MVMFRMTLIAAIFSHSLYIVVSSIFGEKYCAMIPPLETPCGNERQIQREDLFLEITIFLGRKIDKTGTVSM